VRADRGEEAGADPGVLRIAYTTLAPDGAPVEAESLKTLMEAVTLCADLGHRVEPADPEIDRSAVVPTFLTIAAANTVVNLAGHPTAGRPPRSDEVERVTWATARMGDRVTGADYVRAIHTAHRLGRQIGEAHRRKLRWFEICEASSRWRHDNLRDQGRTMRYC